jgi:SAM-dependent methyltransferase
MNEIILYEKYISNWTKFLLLNGSVNKESIKIKLSINPTRWLEYRKIIFNYLKFFKVNRNELKYLDIGSGYTIFPLWFIELGFNTTIFDLPARKDKLELYDNLPYVKSKINNFKRVYGDITLNECLNSKYDLITCISVIEHIEEDVKAFNNIIEMLDVGGIAILTFPISGKYIEWRSNEYYLTLSKSFSPKSVYERWIDKSKNVDLLNIEYYYFDKNFLVPGNGWINFLNSYNCFFKKDESFINNHLCQVEKLVDACEPFFQTTCVLTIKKI